jgi:hypothetical protein
MNYNSIFYNKINNYFQLYSIYRTIIVVYNNNYANIIYNKLILNDHNVIIINNINTIYKINFDKLEERVVIINYYLFYYLIFHLFNYNLLHNFNFIIFYNIDYKIKSLLLNFYNFIYKFNNTIFL